MARAQDIHVGPLANDLPRKWVVYRGRATNEIARATTQALAIAIGKKEAQRTKVELFIHGRNGQIRDKNSYGNDPKRRKG